MRGCRSCFEPHHSTGTGGRPHRSEANPKAAGHSRDPTAGTLDATNQPQRVTRTQPSGHSVRMAVGRGTGSGLPDVPTLTEVIAAWGDAGHWAGAVDHQWRYIYVSDELDTAARGQVGIDEFMFGAGFVGARLAGKAG